MIKSIIFLIGISLFLLPLETIAEEKIDINISMDYASEYIWRGYNLVPDNKPCFQPSITLTSKSGLMLNIWTSFPMVERGTLKELDEVDFTGEYTSMIGELFGYTLGTWWFVIPTQNSFFSARTYAIISLNTILSPYLRVEYEFVNDNNTYFELGGSHTHNLNDAFGITAGAIIGYDNGQLVEKNTINHIDLSIVPTYSFGNISLYGQVHYIIIPDKDANINEDDSEFWFGIGLSTDLILP